MKEVGWIVLYTIIEQMNYMLTYRVILNEKFKNTYRIILFMGSICVIQGIIACCYIKHGNYDSIILDMINIVCGICIPIFLLKRRKIKIILMYPIVILGVSLVNMGIMYIVFLIFRVSWEVHNSISVATIFGSITVCLLILYHCIVNKHREEKTGIVYSNKQYVVILFGIISSIVIMGCSKWMLQDGNITYNAKVVCSIAMTVASVAFVLISVWQGKMLLKESELKRQQIIYENYLKLQEERINALIEADQKIRRFRHDMRAHITVMKSLCENIEDKALIKYIEELEENSALYKVKKYTGNNAVDALINERFSEAKKMNIEVSWDGMYITEMQVSIYDMCTILSNLLTNAIEACEQITKDVDKVIRGKVYPYGEKIYICIENTCNNRKIEGNIKELRTTKEDSINHGLGLKNVSDIVEKYHGLIEFSCEDNWFKMEIIL